MQSFSLRGKDVVTDLLPSLIATYKNQDKNCIMSMHQKAYHRSGEKYRGTSDLQESSSYIDDRRREPIETFSDKSEEDIPDRASGFGEGPKLVNPAVRLSGAARKRLKVLLSQNMEYEEAINLCHLPIRMFKDFKPGDKPPKMSSREGKVSQRTVSNSKSHKSDLPRTLKASSTKQKDPAPKKAKIRDHQKSSYTSATQKVHQTASSPRPPSRNVGEAGSFRVGIQNKEPMTNFQLDLVRKAILTAIANSSIGKGSGPRFGGCSLKTGWLLITCENQESKRWLQQHITTLKPWPEAELSFVHESNLPKPKVGVVFIPSSETTDANLAIALMRTQNDGLNTELWEILNTQVDEAGLTLTIALDDHSVDAIRSMDHKVQLGFKKVTFTSLSEEKCNDRTPFPSTFVTYSDPTWTEFSESERHFMQPRPSVSNEFPERERHFIQPRPSPATEFSERDRHGVPQRSSLSKEYSKRDRHGVPRRSSPSTEFLQTERNCYRGRRFPSTEYSERDRHGLQRRSSNSTEFSERERHEKDLFAMQGPWEESQSLSYSRRPEDTQIDIPTWFRPVPTNLTNLFAEMSSECPSKFFA